MLEFEESSKELRLAGRHFICSGQSYAEIYGAVPADHTHRPQSFCREEKTMADAKQERTFIMLKPDAVHRGLIADIIKRFEQKGFKLVALKFMIVCSHFV